ASSIRDVVYFRCIFRVEAAMNILHVGSCEVGEIRNSADAVGYPCSRTASKECSDCGIQLCEDHVETCSGCHAIFCPCFFFRSAQHSKAASADHGQVRERKTAYPPSRVSTSNSEKAFSH